MGAGSQSRCNRLLPGLGFRNRSRHEMGARPSLRTRSWCMARFGSRARNGKRFAWLVFLRYGC